MNLVMYKVPSNSYILGFCVDVAAGLWSLEVLLDHVDSFEEVNMTFSQDSVAKILPYHSHIFEILKNSYSAKNKTRRSR